MKYFFIFIFSLFMVSCANDPIVEGDLNSEGVLVVSITREISEKGFGTSESDYSAVFPLYSENGDAYIGNLESHNFSMFGVSTDGNMAMEHGKLNVEKLSPGSYYIKNWYVTIPSGGGARAVADQIRGRIVFSVVPGKVTYIGNLNIKTNFGTNLLGGTTVRSAAQLQCSDKTGTDIAKFKSVYPKLSSFPISTQLPNC